MNEDRILSQIEVFKLHFEDNLIAKDGKTISFDEAISSEITPKRALVKSVRKLIEEDANPESLGSKFYSTVNEHLKSIYWQEFDNFTKLQNRNKLLYGRICSILGMALLSTEGEDDVFLSSFEKIRQYGQEREKGDPNRSTMYQLLFVALACKKDSKAVSGIVTFFGDVTEFFLGKRLLQFTDDDIGQSFTAFKDLLAQLSDIMKNQWGWNIKDNMDIQCVLWQEFRNNRNKYKSYLYQNRTKQTRSKAIEKKYAQEIKKAHTETETLAIVKQRRGQNALRKELIEKNKGQCVLTHIKTLELLRVSHIKPWSNSNNDERLDPKNCLVLSGLWDLAFDSGLITFDEGGKLLYSEKLKKDKIASRHPVINSRIILDAEQCHYMKWHREHIFQQ